MFIQGINKDNNTNETHKKQEYIIYIFSFLSFRKRLFASSFKVGYRLDSNIKQPAGSMVLPAGCFLVIFYILCFQRSNASSSLSMIRAIVSQ